MPAGFPSTPLLDDFNRADGPLGANWTGALAPGHGTPTIFSNAFVGPAETNDSAMWNPTTYLNSECWVTFNTIDTPGFGYGYVWTRLSDIGAGRNGLVVGYKPGENYWFMYRYIANTGTLIADGIDTAVVSGIRMGMRTTNVGADIVIEAYADATLLTTQTLVGGIASFPELAGAGNIGIQLLGGGDVTTRKLDNFGGGSTSGAIAGRDRMLSWLS